MLRDVNGGLADDDPQQRGRVATSWSRWVYPGIYGSLHIYTFSYFIPNVVIHQKNKACNKLRWKSPFASINRFLNHRNNVSCRTVQCQNEYQLILVAARFDNNGLDWILTGQIGTVYKDLKMYIISDRFIYSIIIFLKSNIFLKNHAPFLQIRLQNGLK